MVGVLDEERVRDRSLLGSATNQPILYHVIILDIIEIDVSLLVEQDVGIAVYYFSPFVFLELDYELVVEFVPIILIFGKTGVVPAI